MSTPISYSAMMKLLNSDNYRTYNLYIAKTLGSVNAAIILSELVQRYEYHEEKNELVTSHKEDGLWFYYTHEKCEERTALSRKEQDAAISIIEKLGLINKIIMGVPGKRHFQINHQKIIELLNNSKKDSRMSEKDKVDCTKGTNCFDQKGQTIYKENHKENHKENQPPPREIGGGDISHSLIYKNTKGEATQVSESDIYSYFLKLPYSTEEIQESIKQVKVSNDFIGNIFKYIEAICLRIHNSKHLKTNELRKKSECDIPDTSNEPKENFGEYMKKNHGIQLGKKNETK